MHLARWLRDRFETRRKKITLGSLRSKSRDDFEKNEDKKYLRYHPSFVCRFIEISQSSLDDDKIPTALHRGFIISYDYR